MEKRLKIYCVDDEGEKKKIMIVLLVKFNMFSWMNFFLVFSCRDKRYSYVVVVYFGKCNKMVCRFVFVGCLIVCVVNCNDVGFGFGEIISCFRFCLGYFGCCVLVD